MFKQDFLSPSGEEKEGIGGTEVTTGRFSIRKDGSPPTLRWCSSLLSFPAGASSSIGCRQGRTTHGRLMEKRTPQSIHLIGKSQRGQGRGWKCCLLDDLDPIEDEEEVVEELLGLLSLRPLLLQDRP
jgi:hypothetical protein